MRKLVFIIEKMPENTPENDSIFLSGDFNGWIPDNVNYKFDIEHNGKLMLILNTDLPYFQYKVTRGSWLKSESSSEGMQVANRIYIEVNDPLIKLTVDGWEDRRPNSTSSVKVLSDDFFIPQLNTRRKITVYIPPEYQKNEHRYPVVYMTDGQNLFDSSKAYGSEWGIDKVLDNIHFWDKQSLIVVAIDSEYKNRRNEFTPFSPESIAPQMLQFITETLKPYIDAHFRTHQQANKTAIVGSSYGAVFALYAAVAAPNSIGNAGIFSPVLSSIEPLLNFIQESGKHHSSKFYFATGLKESKVILKDIQLLYNHLRISGYNENELKISVRPNGEHDGWFWGSEFEPAVRWLLLNPE